MAKKAKSLFELTKVCREILRVSKQYSYLWDFDIWGEDKYNKGRFLGLDSGFIAQDESYHVYVEKKGNKFLINGYSNARKAAETIGNLSGISPNQLRKNFYSSLKQPLGKYLAGKELETLTNPAS